MQSLNLEYIFVAFYNAFTGTGVEAIPGHLHEWAMWAMEIGLALSFLLFFAVMYAHMRLEQVEAEAKHRRHDAVDAYLGVQSHHNERWEHVKILMATASPNEWRNAIIEADIMLFEMLTALGVPGTSIGEQLKSVNRTSFNTIDLAWEAHKVRNQIAHAGSTYVLTEREARRAIDFYRQVFEEFSYI